ncbi:Hypothetical protein CINCED_3A021333 [Cinara cedri]|uniref:Uncharacterized protein n=1 Tax=Cinara cedri TaxID=506608 RepID=A0A5E4MAT9_9HEMI|nr:Hypothetical protein CINCED_3A021333 [Cinara cedri]
MSANKLLMLMLSVLVVMISFVFALPTPADTETMKPAETSHLSFRFGGYPGYGYGFDGGYGYDSGYGYGGYRGGIGLSINSPYYNAYRSGYMMNRYPEHIFFK